MTVGGAGDRWTPRLQGLALPGHDLDSALEDVDLVGEAEATAAVTLPATGQLRARLEGGLLRLGTGPSTGFDLRLDLPAHPAGARRRETVRWPDDVRAAVLAGQAAPEPRSSFHGRLVAPSHAEGVLDVTGMLSLGGPAELTVLRMQLAVTPDRSGLEVHAAAVLSRADLALDLPHRWASDRLVLMVYAVLRPVS